MAYVPTQRPPRPGKHGLEEGYLLLHGALQVFELQPPFLFAYLLVDNT